MNVDAENKPGTGNHQQALCLRIVARIVFLIRKKKKKVRNVLMHVRLESIYIWSDRQTADVLTGQPKKKTYVLERT